MRGATILSAIPKLLAAVSIHAPHARGDRQQIIFHHGQCVSIHAPHARGDPPPLPIFRPDRVSIHAPHARGDAVPRRPRSRLPVSIHAPHARGDRNRSNAMGAVRMFQSTPLMRGATSYECDRRQIPAVSIHAPHARGDNLCHDRPRIFYCFNPRPSCEGRHRTEYCRSHDTGFNPRPSCEGRPSSRRKQQQRNRFQSTPLMRGATSISYPAGV